jgi:TM2 domain-containing membrane protein YozV
MYKIIGGDGKQYGPVSLEQIRRWIVEGRVKADTLVQPDGAQEWKALNAFPELAAELKPPPVSQTPRAPPVVASRASNKIAAGLCGILLGAFGVHKFILGYSGTGGAMLAITLCSLFGIFFTCGLTSIGYVAMHIIGLVEGIIYLTKSDEEFVRIYVDGRREWF